MANDAPASICRVTSAGKMDCAGFQPAQIPPINTPVYATWGLADFARILSNLLLGQQSSFASLPSSEPEPMPLGRSTFF